MVAMKLCEACWYMGRAAAVGAKGVCCIEGDVTFKDLDRAWEDGQGESHAGLGLCS